MSNLLYSIAIILVVIWTIGFFAYNAGNEIHFLLPMAVLIIVVSITRSRNAQQ